MKKTVIVAVAVLAGAGTALACDNQVNSFYTHWAAIGSNTAYCNARDTVISGGGECPADANGKIAYIYESEAITRADGVQGWQMKCAIRVGSGEPTKTSSDSVEAHCVHQGCMGFPSPQFCRDNGFPDGHCKFQNGELVPGLYR